MTRHRHSRLVSTLTLLWTSLLLLVGLILLLRTTAQVTRADPGALFVTPTGGGDCSQASPCDLATALAAASEGDSLYLAQGVYTGTGGAVITLTKGLSLYGGWDGSPTGPVVRDPDAHPTVIDGEEVRRGIAVQGNFAATLDGLQVTRGYVNKENGAGIRVINARLTLRRCRLFANTAEGLGALVGGIYVGGDGALLENSQFFGNTGAAIGLLTVDDVVVQGNDIFSNTGQSGAGIEIQNGVRITVAGNRFYGNVGSGAGIVRTLNSRDIVVRENLFYNNQASHGGGFSATRTSNLTLDRNIFWGNRATTGNGGGLFLDRDNGLVLRNNMVVENAASGTGSGLAIQDSTVRMLHNTLARNTGARGRGVYVSGGSTVWLTNTILVSQTVGIQVSGGSTATLQATLWGAGTWANQRDWQLDSGSLVTGTVNVWGDPDFLAPALGNYHIGPASAALDAGVDAGVPVDIDGQPRPIGPAPDLGADERGYALFLPQVMKS